MGLLQDVFANGDICKVNFDVFSWLALPPHAYGAPPTLCCTTAAHPICSNAAMIGHSAILLTAVSRSSAAAYCIMTTVAICAQMYCCMAPVHVVTTAAWRTIVLSITCIQAAIARPCAGAVPTAGATYASSLTHASNCAHLQLQRLRLLQPAGRAHLLQEH